MSPLVRYSGHDGDNDINWSSPPPGQPPGGGGEGRKGNGIRREISLLGLLSLLSQIIFPGIQELAIHLII